MSKKLNFKKNLVLAGIVLAQASVAQTSAQDNPRAETGLALEEIVVIARKVSENIQDVPMSIQAFDSGALDAAGIRDFGEIASRVPGMTFRFDRAMDAEIFIRGIGSDIQSAGADSAIGIFVDNVYMSRNTGVIADLFDLERVEVLKGPQSLRFGKNIVGGLIHYVTKKPDENFRARGEATMGNYTQQDFAGSIAGPLADGVFGGLTLSSRKRDGFAKNTLGGDEESVDATAARAQLRFLPNDDLEVQLSADYNRRRDGGRWVHVMEAGDSGAVRFNRFFAPPIEGLPADFLLPNRNAPFQNDNPRRGPKNASGYDNADVYGTSLEVNWSPTADLSLTSITAIRDAELDAFEDGCGVFWDFPFDPATNTPDISSAVQGDVFQYLATVPDCFFNQTKTDDVRQFSQEFRLAGTINEKTSWSLGTYYLKEEIERSRIVTFLFPDFDAITDFAFANAFGGSVAAPAGGISNAFTDSDAENYGIFAEVSYELTPEIAIEAGVRYARDEKDFTVNRFGDSFDRPIQDGFFLTTDSQSSDAWLPSVTLTWTPDDDSTYYARYARGYKAGGWSGENSGNPEDAVVSFDPELADSLELGAKLLLLERRLRLNMAAHYTEYDDLQVQQFVQLDPTRPPDNFVVNAANGTEAYGFELDTQFRVTTALTVNGTYAYTRCEFAGSLIVDSAGTDVDGNTCRRTPEHAVSLGAQLSYPVGPDLVLSFGADYQWSDEYFFDIENSPDEVIGSQYTANLRAAIASADDRWELTAWGKNVTDELNRSGVLNLFGTYYTNYTPPRTYGMTLRFNF